MQVGIEVELNSATYDMYYIQEESNLSFNEFRQKDGLGEIGVKMSEEYYSSTIEYNFTPFEHIQSNFRKVKRYLEKEIEAYGLDIGGDRPAFVGTHIHIFSEDKLRLSKPRLLAGVLAFIAENIDDLGTDSLKRLLLAHQLWGNWSWRNEHKWRNFIQDCGFDPDYYSSAESKPKYSPIISSSATPYGKPQSLEIRVIPNEFMFNGKGQELMKLIDTRELYQRDKMKVVDFLKIVADKLGYSRRQRRSGSGSSSESQFYGMSTGDLINDSITANTPTASAPAMYGEQAHHYSSDNSGISGDSGRNRNLYSSGMHGNWDFDIYEWDTNFLDTCEDRGLLIAMYGYLDGKNHTTRQNIFYRRLIDKLTNNPF